MLQERPSFHISCNLCVLPGQLKTENKAPCKLLRALVVLCTRVLRGCASRTYGRNMNKNTCLFERMVCGVSRALVMALWVFLCANASFTPTCPFTGDGDQNLAPPRQASRPIHAPKLLGHCSRHVLVSLLPQHHLMRIASNDAHLRCVCFRTSRPLTLFLTAETDSARSCQSWGRSQPICYGYKREVLQMPQQGGSNRRCLAL